MTTPDPAGNYPEPDPPRPADPAPEPPPAGTDVADGAGGPASAGGTRAGGTGTGGGEPGGLRGDADRPEPTDEAGPAASTWARGAGPAGWAEADVAGPAGPGAAGGGGEAPNPWTGAGTGPAGPPRPVTDEGVQWSTPTWSDETGTGRIGVGSNGAPPPYPPYPPDALHPEPGVPFPAPRTGPLGGPTEGWPPTGRPQTVRGSGDGSRVAVIVGVAAAAELLLCCVSAVVGALVWGRDVADRMRDPDRVGMNQPGRDGDLEFLVTGVTCGVPRLGDGFVEHPATGQFCLVDVVVSNVGDRPVAFSDMIQRAYGPTERRYAADSAAGLIANREQQVFHNEINPGNDVTAVLVYDIPADDRIVRLVLRESQTSPGVEVDTA